jgi:hypothetical protein
MKRSGYPQLTTRFLAAALLLTLAGPALAEILPLAKDQQAPVEGLLFDADASRKLVEDLRDARSSAAIVETLRAETAAQAQQIRELLAQVDALKAEAQARAVAMAIAEDREKRRSEDDARVAKVMDRTEAALERAATALEKSQARIEVLERRVFWAQVLGILGPVLLLFGGL